MEKKEDINVNAGDGGEPQLGQTPDEQSGAKRDVDRRKFVRDMGIGALAVGLGHFFLLGPAPKPVPAYAPEDCMYPGGGFDECGTSGLMDVDVCDSSSKDYCPGGRWPEDVCGELGGTLSTGNSTIDNCDGGGSAEDKCPTGEFQSDSCPGGSADRDICSGTHPAENDHCPGGMPSVDACDPTVGFTDYCPGGNTDADECYQGTGDVCSDAFGVPNVADKCPNQATNPFDDNCLIIWDICAAGSGDQCEHGLGGEPITCTDDCPGGGDDVDECLTGDHKDECPTGSADTDKCINNAYGFSLDVCPGGGSDVDVCESWDADECSPNHGTGADVPGI